METSTVGIKQPDWPITGVVTSTSLKYMRNMPRGTTSSNRLTMLTDAHEVPPESEMEDNESITANLGTLSIPSQIHQLATVLHNILISDREANAAILEKLENPQDDLNASPIQVFGAGDLAHLASHLATTQQILSQHAQNLEMEDLSEIDD